MKIKFLLDENMPFALLEFLTNRGYDTIHLKKIEKVGIKNGEVYNLITCPQLYCKKFFNGH